MAPAKSLSSPSRLPAHDRAAMTDNAAKAIITAETRARIAKTEKLRELRLQAEAANAKAVDAAAKPVTKPKKRAVTAPR